MPQVKISALQFLLLIVLFELGSAVVVGVGLEAKQDVWLVILLGGIIGILLFTLYDYILRASNGLTFFASLKCSFGKIVGTFLSVMYIAYFLYISSRVLRDFGAIMLITLLPETPMVVVNALIAVAVVFVCYLGVEVIGRMAEIFFPYVILFGGLLLSFIYIGGLPEFKNLQPVLAKGFQPILNTVFPEVVSFPYAELIVFLMFIPYLNTPNIARKTGYVAIIISSSVLMFVNMTIIAVLGADQATRSVLPLVEALGRVNIAEFIQRLDPLALIVLMVCGYFKILIFFCASVIGLNELTNEKFKKRLLIPMGLLLVTLSIVIATNWIEHIQIGIKWVTEYVTIPLAVIFPIIFALILLMKNNIPNKREGL